MVTAIVCGWRLVNWAVINAVWSLPHGATSDACRAVAGRGACWAVITERYRFILFGPYPAAEQWRAALVCGMFAALFAGAMVRSWRRPPLLLATLAIELSSAALMRGGFAGLPEVPTELWGGLPLTFILAGTGFTLALPAAVLLALGRRSQMPVVRLMSGTYVELVRGVPLLSLLFVASVVLPLVLPAAFVFDKLVRTLGVFAMVIAAYQAQVVGAGLDALPRTQHEAAAALGFSYWPAMMLISLPQALRSTVPATVNTFIAFFKDTTLVTVIGLFDLLGAAHAVIADGRWVGFGVEVYLFVAIVYGALCFGIACGGRHLERTLAAGQA